MLRRLLPIIIFVIGADIVSIQAATNIFGSSTLLYGIWTGATVLVLASLFLYFSREMRKRSGIARPVLMSTFFMLLFPKVIVSVLLLIEDVVRLTKLMANGVITALGSDFNFGLGRSFWWDAFALSFALLLTLAFVYGAIFNVYRYQIRKVKVKLVKLPKAFDGLRVVQISDIHSGSLSNREAVAKAVDRINSLSPDLIFFTGDLVNNIAEEARGFVDIFAKLQAKHGVYSILGNHDYGDYMAWPDEATKQHNLETLKTMHAQMGWRLLLNEHVHIERSGNKIAVAGVENWSARGRFKSYGRLEQTLHGIQDAMTVLLLSHDPSHWEGEVLDHPAKVDITFSGHTHGMQFGLDLPWFKWSPVKYLYRQWAGLYQQNDQYLYVNRGFGVIGYPGRVGILPEITLFTLQTTQSE
ncbi:MAG TPA: metallophosphoesterase [Chitinophagales bacterium]|nr:metallophosphoesterase [Chitinophagales bacterium]HNI53732.1 metallophosphoesterase [Chitinophagales bacterium]HNO27352.1 metallophosphoesterase [Chitinophagales bacterium]